MSTTTSPATAAATLEYHVIMLTGTAADHSTQINAAAAQGWTLFIVLATGWCCFSRPVAATPTAGASS